MGEDEFLEEQYEDRYLQNEDLHAPCYECGSWHDGACPMEIPEDDDFDMMLEYESDGGYSGEW